MEGDLPSSSKGSQTSLDCVSTETDQLHSSPIYVGGFGLISEHVSATTSRISFGYRRPENPGHVEIRRVSPCGAFRLQSGQYFLSNALKGEEIGLKENEKT